MLYNAYMKKTKKQPVKSNTATLQRQVFVDEFMKHGNASEAIRQAMKKAGRENHNLSRHSIGVKAHRMLNNEKTKQLLKDRQAILEASATLGAQRIQQIISSEQEANALKASIFSVEMIEGKATQRIEQQTTAVRLQIDLSGTPQIEDKPALKLEE